MQPTQPYIYKDGLFEFTFVSSRFAFLGMHPLYYFQTCIIGHSLPFSQMCWYKSTCKKITRINSAWKQSVPLTCNNVIQPVKKLKSLRSYHSRKAPSCHCSCRGWRTWPDSWCQPPRGRGEGDVPVIDLLGAVHSHQDHLVPSVSEHVVTVIRIVKNLLMVVSLRIIIRLFFSDEELWADVCEWCSIVTWYEYIWGRIIFNLLNGNS